MATTLLVGHPDFTWRQWIKDNVHEWLNLDPREADHGPATRAFYFAQGKVKDWRFIGTLDPTRNPLGLLAAGVTLSQNATDGTTVLLFPVRSGPVLRQLALELAQILRPTQVLVPTGSGLASLGWPVGAQEIDLPTGFPPMVVEAQRRARWLEMLENAVEHTLDLSKVTTLGSRIGSGRKVQLSGWGDWAEVGGGTLHLVGDHDPTEEEAGVMLDTTHATKLTVQSPASYQGLLCSFAREDGEDFGIGVLESFDAKRGLATIKSTAVQPAPVRILKIGSLKIDALGRERGETRPWSL